MARILIIDDCTARRSATARILTQIGHVAVEAVGHEQAWAACEQCPSECIVINIPSADLHGDGGLLGRLRQRGVEAPAVAMTAEIQSMSLDVCERWGISGFVATPVKPAALRACVEMVLSEAPWVGAQTAS